MISYLMVHDELHNLSCAYRSLPTVPGDDHALEPRQSEANRVALEKNSYNFLESVICAVQLRDVWS
jgi:hypothetical protein